MNKQLNRAIAHLEEKYGWIFRESQDPHNLKGECPLGWDIWYPTVGCSQFYGWDNSAFITHHVPEETIIWRAKSAGWTGEDWEPKEGDRTSLLEQENKMLREEVAELNRKLKDQDDGIEEMSRCF